MHIQGVIFSPLLALFCLAAVVVNFVYYKESRRLWLDACSHDDVFSEAQVCGDLAVVSNTEIGCAVS